MINSSIFSILAMIMLTERDSERYSIKIHVAFRVIISSSRRPKTSVDFLLRNVVTTESASTANVVVLIPPAVDPGDAPMNIRIMIKKRPLSVSAARSIVLNPAVLALTDWNEDAAICSDKVRPSKEAVPCSKRNKRTEPLMIKNAVTVRTSFV